jgi:hypothetical protein
MANSLPQTPTSCNSIYFDAPLAHFNEDDMATSTDQPVTSGDAEAARNPSVANPSISRDNADGAAGVVGTESQDSAEAEMDAPAYIPPGPDDKLSRSYLPIDSKPPLPALSDSRKQPMDSSDTAATTAGRQSPERSTHPECATSMTSQSDVVRSPTSISRRSGGGNKRDEGSAFANGAAVTGPNSHPDMDQSVHTRAATAETNLSPKTKSKLTKSDRKFLVIYLNCSADTDS